MSFPNDGDHSQNPEWGETRKEAPAPRYLIEMEFKRKIQVAVETHKKVAELRKQVLLQRHEFKDSAERIRQKRDVASDAEASYMKIVREYNNENSEERTRSMASAYALVEEARDELGVLEADHLQTEVKLTGSEWKLTRAETEFWEFDIEELLDQVVGVQNSAPVALTPPPPPPPPPSGTLLAAFPPSANSTHYPPPPPPPVPPPPSGTLLTAFPPSANSTHFSPPPPPPVLAASKSQHRPPSKDITRNPEDAVVKHDDLIKDLRQEQTRDIEERVSNTITECGGPLDEGYASDFAERHPTLNNKLAACEPIVPKSSGETTDHESASRKHNPNHGNYSNRALKGECPYKRLLTDNTLSMITGKSSVLQNIQDWLLLELTENAMHRRLYRNILHAFGIRDLDNESLRQWASNHWRADKSGDDRENWSHHEAEREYTIKYTPGISKVARARSLNEVFHPVQNTAKAYRDNEWPTTRRALSEPNISLSVSILASFDSSIAVLSQPKTITTILKSVFSSNPEGKSYLENSEMGQDIMNTIRDIEISSVTSKDRESQKLSGFEQPQQHQDNIDISLGHKDGSVDGEETQEEDVESKSIITVIRPLENFPHQISGTSDLIMRDSATDPGLCIITKQQTKPLESSTESSVLDHESHHDLTTTSTKDQSKPESTTPLSSRHKSGRGTQKSRPRRLFQFFRHRARLKST